MVIDRGDREERGYVEERIQDTGLNMEDRVKKIMRI